MATSQESIFAPLEALPPDVVLHTAVAFRNDPAPNKVNLGIGAYRTENGSPHVFQVVRKIDKQLADDEKIFKEYLREDGLEALKPMTQKLAFGRTDDRICSVQVLSGTGGLSLVASFLKKVSPNSKVYVSTPTWPNHNGVFTHAGFELASYPYWNQASRSLDIQGMLKCLSEAPDRSIVILHACAHNPTGVDPTADDWKKIVEVVQNRKHIALLDSAYQGFATGDLARDRFAMELFLESGLEFFVTQSFAKNLGLYGERIGMMHAVCKNKDRAEVIITHLRVLARRIWSNPPIHGALIVERVLGNEENYKEWLDELKTVSQRLQDIRKTLRDGLVAKSTPGNWDHVVNQIGMFSFTGLTPEQCERMIGTWHVYMLKNGRISLAGLNKSNVQHVIDAIHDCVTNVPAPKAAGCCGDGTAAKVCAGA